MKTFFFILFLALSYTIIFFYTVYTSLIPVLFEGVKVELFVLYLCIAAFILKVLGSLILHKLKIALSGFNSYGDTGRQFIIIPAWIFSGLWIIAKIDIVIKYPSGIPIAILIFNCTALLIMIVNFCYTKYDRKPLQFTE